MKPRGLQLKFLLPLLLLLLLLLLQYQLWFGAGNLHDVWKLRAQVDAQQQQNLELTKRNQALAAEVQDLKTGTAAVEERARTELGMIKRGERFYQIVRQPVPAATTSAPPHD